MGFMVFRKYDRASVTKFLSYEIRNPELLLDPQGHGLNKGFDACRGIGHIGFKEALKLDEWLVIECHIIYFVGCDATLFQRGLNRKFWKSVVVLFSRKALLLYGTDGLTVSNQASSAVMIIS
jgi:hypothetical protein